MRTIGVCRCFGSSSRRKPTKASGHPVDRRKSTPSLGRGSYTRLSAHREARLAEGAWHRLVTLKRAPSSDEAWPGGAGRPTARPPHFARARVHPDPEGAGAGRPGRRGLLRGGGGAAGLAGQAGEASTPRHERVRDPTTLRYPITERVSAGSTATPPPPR